MKQRYYLTFSCTTVHPSDPGFETLREARQALGESIKEEMQRAKRWCKSTACIRSGDSFAIHATRDTQSPLWTRGAIVSF